LATRDREQAQAEADEQMDVIHVEIIEEIVDR
jgi:hypothetical protein